MIEQQNNPIENVDAAVEQVVDVNAAQAPTSAVEFLRAFFEPGSIIVLTAINPEQVKGASGKDHIVTKSFEYEDDEGITAFISEWNGKWNLYFTMNPVFRMMDKKPARTDIAKLKWLHVDIDPRVVHSPEELAEEQQRIEKLFKENLPAGIPPPSVVVFSGSGYQGFWPLEDGLELDGSEEQAENAKLWNITLERAFGADSCHNIDRIMRLPGTMNVPNEKKMKSKGRTGPVDAVLVKADFGLKHSLSAFTPAASQKTKSGTQDVNVGEVIEPVKDLGVLDQWKVPGRIKVIIEKGFHPDETNKPHDDRSLWVFDVVCGLVRSKVPDEVIYSIITDQRFAISAHVLDQKNVDRCARKQIADAKAAVADDESLKFGDDDKPTWRQLAQAFIDAQVTPLLRYAGEWLAYRHGAYAVRDDETVRSAVYDLYSESSSASVSNVLDAAKGLVLKDQHDFDPPCWLDDRAGPDASEQLVVRNGIVDMTTGELRDHDPQLFTYNALDYDYDPDAPKPERWLKFVNEVFPEDSIDLVQQIGGYLLTPDTSRQAIFVFVGVSGSGKSTFGRVLSGILGRHNVCSPSLSGLGTQFGQQVLIGKTVALISEMKLDKRDAKEAVARVLLNISGEDPVAIPRKNKTDWEGRLGTRVVILANTPPTLSDASGALMRRYVVVEMPTSFVGREDPNLEDALLAERSGILKWFIEGRRKLPRRFVTPASSADVIEQVDRLGSPVKAFVADRCVFSPEAQCTKDQLYGAYGSWHNKSGLPQASKFGKELFSARLLEAYRDKVKSKQPGQKKGDERRPSRVWAGIRLMTQDELKEQWDDERAAHSYEAVDPEANPEDLPF